MNSNVGLLHEALVSQCAIAVVGGRSKAASTAMRLSKRFFAQGKPLAAELKLHLSLCRPRGLTETAAASLLKSIKERVVADASLDDSVKKCAGVLSRALGDVKMTLSAEDHKRHATAANLLEAWRRGGSLTRVAALESAVVKMMTQPAVAETSDAHDALAAPAPIVKRMMTVRLAEAYGEKLTGAHREIVVAAVSGDHAALRERATAGSARMRACAAVGRLDKSAAASLEELAEKLDAIVSASDADVLSDSCVAQLMACVDVERELETR